MPKTSIPSACSKLGNDSATVVLRVPAVALVRAIHWQIVGLPLFCRGVLYNSRQSLRTGLGAESQNSAAIPQNRPYVQYNS